MRNKTNDPRETIHTEQTKAPQVMSLEEKDDFRVIIRNTPWLYEPLLTAIDQLAGQSQTLLDVGCGDGYLLSLIHQRHPALKLSGTDIDPYFINRAESTYPFHFTIRDAKDLRADYDIITCNPALHHFANPLKVLSVLLGHANNALIISDQLRPLTEKELTLRLKRRKDFIDNKDAPFYEKNERQSILEAFNKKEIEALLKPLKATITYFDNDYYERFAAMIKNPQS